MRSLFAAFVLIASASAHAQSAVAPPAPVVGPVQDLSFAVPLAGDWRYASTTDGSEATFVDGSTQPRLWIRCSRPTRRILVSRPAMVAAPFIDVWTSSMSRSVPASFDPTTLRLTINLAAYDALNDAMAYSRGRLGVTIKGQTPLTVPPWEEVARVIEDCRV